jgi:4'-phosphopantetheinyl transferase
MTRIPGSSAIIMLRQLAHTVGDDEVHVWHLLAERVAEPVGGALLGLLSAAERARMNCLRHEPDRALFLLARGMVRTVLASYLGCASHEVRFAANDYGKPIVDANEHRPLRFNLTHSRGAVALAVSGAREVGIDVEERCRRVEYLDLAERFFAEPEARYLRGLAAEQLADAFFAIWTLKEAYVKGIGRGLSFPLEAFCFELDGRRLCAFRPLADFVARDWHFHQFDLAAHHCGALAVQGPAAAVHMRDWAAAFLPT